VKVLDFGIAKLVERALPEAPGLTRGDVIGTPSYLAPERAMGLEYGAPADVYSVGVILYEALAGRLPFPSLPDEPLYDTLLRQVTQPVPALEVPSLPQGVEALVLRTMAKDPAERPTAEELAGELAAFG